MTILGVSARAAVRSALPVVERRACQATILYVMCFGPPAVGVAVSVHLPGRAFGRGRGGWRRPCPAGRSIRAP